MENKRSIWRQAPFIRLLVALAVGILLQEAFPADPFVLFLLLLLCMILVLVHAFLPLDRKFRLQRTVGLFLQLSVALAGALLFWRDDLRHRPGWFGHARQDSLLLATLDEEPLEKEKTWKAEARVEGWMEGVRLLPAEGRVILYFRKDSLARPVYGQRLLLAPRLREIRSTGNPGAFDYRLYNSRKGVTHQAYLQTGDFRFLSGNGGGSLQRWVIESRGRLVAALRTYIPGSREQGLAEALLIGYKEDLDKDLVQAYADTGVVHVIAISGLHLGLVYGILLVLAAPLRQRLPWLRALLLIAALWAFSLLAGAQPSVLRSAVMFTCLALSEAFSRKSVRYNTLALSAFLLLCHHPNWLWDAGFQLSYSAVLSILVFFQPLYRRLEFGHPLVDAAWKLNAVTLSAQILTLPVSIYHFHRFPLLFLLTNMVAVPLSSILLFGEIALCLLLSWTSAARLLGGLLGMGIGAMNAYVERLNRVSFGVWEGLQIDGVQAVLLTGFLLALGFWLMEKYRAALMGALLCLLGFTVLRSVSFVLAARCRKLVIYNLPRRRAIDLILGRRAYFAGDTSIFRDLPLCRFHLQPSRVLHRVRSDSLLPEKVWIRLGEDEKTNGKNLDSTVERQDRETALILVLGGSQSRSIAAYASQFPIRRVVLDSSVPSWKALRWHQECDSLRIPCHEVNKEGALEIELGERETIALERGP